MEYILDYVDVLTASCRCCRFLGSLAPLTVIREEQLHLQGRAGVSYREVSHLSKSVQEGLGQSFAPPALSERVLAAKDLCFFMLNLEAQTQFRNEDLSSMIKAGVQALKDRLGSQVQLLEEDISVYTGGSLVCQTSS